MNLKVFCVSFINLLVALAVPAANASPSNLESLLSQSSIEYKKSNFHKSDYLIAKYLGSENANITDAINTIYDRKTKQTPTSFIDGEYSNEFLQFFFTRTLHQWGSNKNDDDDNILVKINGSQNQYVSVWGKPYIETWYILARGKEKEIAYTVGMHSAKVRIGKIHKSDRLHQPCDTFDINGPIQYFYEPIFKDINNNGKKELLLRYNVTVADGYIQVLDIFVPRVKNNYCHLSHNKSYHGRNGFAIFENGKVIVSQQTRKEGESVLGATLQTEKNYSPNGDLINEKKVSNFLRTTNIDILNPYRKTEKTEKKFYEANLLVCLKGTETSPNNCKNLVDTRGPYKTKNECEDRLFEIESNLPKY